MLTIAVVLYLIVAAGSLAMAAKFGLGPLPAPHHAAALQQDGVDLTPKLRAVLRGVYSAMAGAYLGIAILVIYLALGPIRAGTAGTALALCLAGLCVVVPTAWRAWQFQQETGVSSPWPIAAGQGALMVIATLLVLAA
jgi:hypothetical protein